MKSLLKGNEFIRVSNAVAAGTSDINSDHVDMQNADRVAFLVLFGTITSGAATSIKVQQGAASDDSDMADLTGTSVTVADTDNNKIAIVEVERPQERYVRCVVDRGTQNAVVDGIIAIRGGLRNKPVTQGTTVLGSELHASPAEGTA